jgi:murein DD-endopeptidase MepM/ murein hydrolase activator NlpD
MNRFSKNFAVFLLASIILLSNAWAHHYRIIGNNATCEGDNPYVDESVMCMSVSFTDSNKIRMELYKPDYKPFNDDYDPYVMMKRDSYAASATNLASAPLEAVRSVVLVSEYELDDYTFPSNHFMNIYGRMDNSGGGWAWVGPVLIEQIQPFPKPDLYSPGNNASEISRNYQGFNWESISGNPDPPVYRIVVSTKSNFSNFVDEESGRYCTSSLTCWDKVLDQSSYSGFNLSYGSTYYWRVRAGNNIAGGEWSDTRSFTTESQKFPPVATIISISPKSTDNETSVNFKGSGSDPDGGSIKSYWWESSLDGHLSGSSSFSKKLSVGTHTISFQVLDDENTWSDEVKDTVYVSQKNYRPTASIDNISQNPTDNETIISFSGSGRDPDGGRIKSYRWESSIDNYLSSSASFTKKLNVGNHIISFKVMDDEDTWSYEVKEPVTVKRKTYRPTATIISISPNPTNDETLIYFSGSGNDPDGGRIVSYRWESSIDGNLSNAASFEKKLSQGDHTITFKVEDDENTWSNETAQQVSVIRKTHKPIATIEQISPNPANNETFISFSGSGYDPDDGDIQSYHWESSKDGFLSNSKTFSKLLSQGDHTIRFKVQDDENDWSDPDEMSVSVNRQTSKPTATITQIAPDPATTEDTIAFIGSGSDSDGGDIQAYYWESSIEGLLSSLSSFSQKLQAGEHQICLKVEDDEKQLSDPYCQSLVVSEYEDPEKDAVLINNDQTIANVNIQINESHVYYIDVPSYATVLVVKTVDVNGDPVDLYLSKNQIPTTQTYDVRSYSGKENERIRIDARGSDSLNGSSIVENSFQLSEGRYYIMVYSEKEAGTYGIHARYLSLQFPFSGDNWQITRDYDKETHVGENQRFSLDFAQEKCVSYGKPVLAAADGKVTAGYNNGFGNHVYVHHGDGYKTLYAHLATTTVRNDSNVVQGQEIGTCGNTGNVKGSACGHHGGTHIHFTFTRDSKGVKPEPMSGEIEFKQYEFFDGLERNNPSTFVIVDNIFADISGDAQTYSEGYMGEMQFINTSNQPENGLSITWCPQLPEKNNYVVYAHIPQNKSTATVQYKIHHAGGTSDATVNQNNYYNNWVRLGPQEGYSFNAGTGGYVYLNTKDVENNKLVGIDAILWTTPEWGTGGEITPEIPLNLSAVETLSHHLHLSWQPPTGNRVPEKYTIYRNSMPVKTIASSQLSFTDQDVTVDTQYAYQLSATFDTIEGQLSKEVFASISANDDDPENPLPENWQDFDSSAYTYQLMMTAELWDENNLLIADNTDYLGAFVGNECRGYATPNPGPNDSRLFFLQIWSNLPSNETISFRYYNMKTGELSNPLEDYINFVADKSIGTVLDPAQLNISSSITQTLALNSGWNWISLHVVPEDNTLNSVFESIQEHCDRIVGQKGYAEFSNAWFGPLKAIDPDQMYMLKMKHETALSIEGRTLTSEENTISLHQNWNWVPYLSDKSISLNQGMSSIDGAGKRIVGQKGYAEFTNQWWGSLHYLEPGRGYKILMNQPANLVYPEPALTKRTKKQTKASAGFDNATLFEYQGMITGYLNTETNSSDQVVAYVNDELRGTGKMIKTPDGYRCFIQVWSNKPGENIRFKYYDSANEQIKDIDNTFIFHPDMCLGSIQAPEMLAVKSPTDSDELIDINGDQSLDIKDVIIMLKILSGFQ